MRKSHLAVVSGAWAIDKGWDNLFETGKSQVGLFDLDQRIPIRLQLTKPYGPATERIRVNLEWIKVLPEWGRDYIRTRTSAA